jgi:hypothetical protein
MAMNITWRIENELVPVVSPRWCLKRLIFAAESDKKRAKEIILERSAYLARKAIGKIRPIKNLSIRSTNPLAIPNRCCCLLCTIKLLIPPAKSELFMGKELRRMAADAKEIRE